MGCRTRASKGELLRLVLDGDMVRPDPRGNRPGRGAYIHFDLRCLQAAERRRAWSRAFRESRRVDASPVADHLAALGRV
ncbi:hypothetical protein GCM10027294_00580 [Marinactinospora endophytica]|uniref:YlxR family protein n=1 Tax=Marinactinospora thermotolerans TaxID=531310 RepID=UPI0022861029|nr:YlxR family protein [Marinactinospora thermotolerans]